jgi:TAG lipase/steryl ester hydrolase/phospholipase A2/LPA acyltransferase
MQHSGLFAKAMAGTKLLVEEYHDVVAAGLNFVCDSPIADEEITLETKLAFFNETRHSYGRTALLLSGGAYLGFYHMGVVKTLWQSGMLPRVISGASAGSIMAAVIGTRTDEEFHATYTDPKYKNMLPGFETNFFRYSDRFHSKLATKLQYMVPQQIRWLTQPILSALFDKKVLNLDTTHFKEILMRDVGLFTFQEAFDHTGRIINITVAPLNNYDPPRFCCRRLMRAARHL